MMVNGSTGETFFPRAPRWTRLGVPVDAVGFDGAVACVRAMLEHQTGGWVATPNPEIVYSTWRNPSLLPVMAGASLSVADGIGLIWASRVLGGPALDRVHGIDLVSAVLSLCAEEGLPVFFLGGLPGVAAGAARRAAELWPGLRTAGAHHGYFDKAGEPEVLAAVVRAGPRLVLAGMGHPKQELWLAENIQSVPGAVGIACGGTLDVLAGFVRRAPAWIRQANLEWLFRLLSAPGTRGRRALVLPSFVARVLAMRLGIRR